MYQAPPPSLGVKSRIRKNNLSLQIKEARCSQVRIAQQWSPGSAEGKAKRFPLFGLTELTLAFAQTGCGWAEGRAPISEQSLTDWAGRCLSTYLPAEAGKDQIWWHSSPLFPAWTGWATPWQDMGSQGHILYQGLGHRLWQALYYFFLLEHPDWDGKCVWKKGKNEQGKYLGSSASTRIKKCKKGGCCHQTPKT